MMVLDRTGLAVFALLCAAFHETGHLTALKIFKIDVEEISVRAFGVSIKLRNDSRVSYRQEIVVSLAGAAANLIFALAAFILQNLGVLPYSMNVLWVFNLIIACFNLLPIGPLDGGRCLECILLTRMHYSGAQIIVNVVSFLIIIPLTIAGYFLVVSTGYNFSLIMAAVYLAVLLLLKGRLIIGGSYPKPRLR